MKYITTITKNSIFEFYKKSKIFYKFDIAILIIAIVVCCVFFAFKKPTGAKVEVCYENVVIFSQALNIDGEFLFDKNGKNKIVIKNKTVFVQKADCSNQICVHSKPISRSGEIIVCAPHLLLIKISGQSSLDGVTGR